MNFIDTMNKVNAIGKYFVLAIVLMNLLSVVFAGTDNLKNALQELCEISQTFLGAAALVLIVLAGTTYAIGQIMGAETRARASVWATAMLTGAIVGAVIYLVAPAIIRLLIPAEQLGGGFTQDQTNPCALGGTTES